MILTEPDPSREQLALEVERLRARLAAAEDALRAIHNGEVDMLICAWSAEPSGLHPRRRRSEPIVYLLNR